jgi:hypothetical protein
MMIAEIAAQTTQTVAQTGIGLGSAIAVVCSWQRFLSHSLRVSRSFRLRYFAASTVLGPAKSVS